jgi:hypothetical protein
MKQWVRMYTVSVSTLRNVMPVIGALVAIRPEHTNIATSIPGLGACKSTYCKPERRAWANGH